MDTSQATHSHVFLGESHAQNERGAHAVIGLCIVMMALEIIGGWLFGSIALVADGLHMSTHAGALLLAALAYRLARTHAHDRRFSFGTGKFGDLAGFASAIILGMLALLIGWEAISRLVAPVPIHFGEAIPIACLGLAVNLTSAWLLGDGHHHDEHEHDHDHVHEHSPVRAHAGTMRDNNMRAAFLHIIADIAVSVFVIIGLGLAYGLSWTFMDPVAGLLGACVIASWSLALVRDTGAILLDVTPDKALAERIKTTLEAEGDAVRDLHVWRLGPGHLGAIVSISSSSGHSQAYFRGKLVPFSAISHLTIEIVP